MPLDVRGRTRATLKTNARVPTVLVWSGREPAPRGEVGAVPSRGQSRLQRVTRANRLRAGDRGLQLSPVNEEFRVGVRHQLAPIKSLPFVHTARRYLR